MNILFIPLQGDIKTIKIVERLLALASNKVKMIIYFASI